MQTSEVLNTAADLIESRGWVQGTSGWDKGAGGLCLEGGILAAMGLDRANVADFGVWIDCPARHAVRSYLDDPAPYDWNDEPGRTASEVVEVLRACAVIEASRERESAEVSA